MPRLNKRKRHCLLAGIASGEKRRAVDSDSSRMGLGLASIVHGESEESVIHESEWDKEEEEDEEDDGLEIQDLNMAADAYEELMKNTIDVDFSTIQSKYQRGVQACRQTTWRHKKAQEALHQTAIGCRPLTAYFTPLAEGSRSGLSTSSLDTNGIISEPKEESREDILLSGIQELRKKLQSKKQTPVGQDYQRHLAVLHFLQLQLHHSNETRISLSLIIAHSFNRGVKMAKHLRKWERCWLTGRYIPEGFQGLRSTRF
ncbi:hypothetical protein BDZ91DRAFT_709543, partial [Kalaharituber pfeilii]